MKKTIKLKPAGKIAKELSVYRMKIYRLYWKGRLKGFIVDGKLYFNKKEVKKLL